MILETASLNVELSISKYKKIYIKHIWKTEIRITTENFKYLFQRNLKNMEEL